MGGSPRLIPPLRRRPRRSSLGQCQSHLRTQQIPTSLCTPFASAGLEGPGIEGTRQGWVVFPRGERSQQEIQLGRRPHVFGGGLLLDPSWLSQQSMQHESARSWHAAHPGILELVQQLGCEICGDLLGLAEARLDDAAADGRDGWRYGWCWCL